MLSLKVFSYGKFKLFDEYFLESIKVVLFVKDEHSLLVINRINRTKTKWTIAISYQITIFLNRCKYSDIFLIIGSF